MSDSASAPPGGNAAADVTAIAAAVLRCPSVAALEGGRFGEVTTYLPGQRVPGVAVREGRLLVSVVGTRSTTAPELLSQVLAATRPLTAGMPVDVVFADIDLAGERTPADAPREPPRADGKIVR